MRPASRIQHRYATAAEWAAENSILRRGEMGIESDTRKAKFGDGVTTWNSLAYAVDSSGGGGGGDVIGTSVYSGAFAL